MTESPHQRAKAGWIVIGLASIVGAAWLAFPSSGPPAGAPQSTPPELPPRPAEPPVATPSAPLPGPSAVPTTSVDAPRMSGTTVKEVAGKGNPIRFTERRYDPPLPLPCRTTPSAPAALTSPESLMAESTSAMRRGDWDSWLALWDPQSRAFMTQHFAEAGVTRDTLIAGWKSEFASRTFVLLRRIDTPGYVIVYSRREDALDISPEARQPLAMKRDATGRWWLTHDLRESPVFFYDSDAKLEVREVGSVGTSHRSGDTTP